MNFKEYLALSEVPFNLSVPHGVVIPNTVFGALPDTWTGTQGVPAPSRANIKGGFVGSPWHHQTFNLGLPKVVRTGIIRHIDDKVNPILISLSDRTNLYVPFDAFEKIQSRPEKGKTMVVVFQRRMDDKSPNPTKITSIKCY